MVAVPAPMPGEVEVRHRMPDGRPDVSAAVATTHGLRCAEQDADHIARYNPARILAELAAKRRIVDQYEDAQRNATTPTPEQLRTQEDRAVIARTYGYAVRLLALPHAEHPDYRKEWSP